MNKVCGQCRSASLIIFISAVLSYGSIIPGPAAGAELDIYGVLENHNWREFDDEGMQLLRESGILGGVGVSYRNERSNNVTINSQAQVFGGTVDYDGYACDPTDIDPFTGMPRCVAAKTDVDYFGLKLQGDLGRRSAFVDRFIEPFGGLGLRLWSRDLNDGVAEDGTPTAGYEEQWFTLNARLGVRGGMDLSDRSQIFGEVALKLPLYNRERVYQNPDVTLKPGKKSSWFAEAGMKINRLKGSVFYETMNFSQSPIVDIGGGFGIFQPRSEASMYGLKLGFLF